MSVLFAFPGAWPHPPVQVVSLPAALSSLLVIIKWLKWFLSQTLSEGKEPISSDISSLSPGSLFLIGPKWIMFNSVARKLK